MSDRSAIEWTDATWNPVRGCTKVSPGCKFCYAEVFAERFRSVPGHPFELGFDLRLVPEKLDQPLHWRRPERWQDLHTTVRPEWWLPKHVNELVRELKKEGAITADPVAGRKFGAEANPLLRLAKPTT